MKTQIHTTALLLLTIIALFLGASGAKAQNNALDFDGVNDRVDLGNMSALSGASQATIEYWIKPGALGAYKHHFNFSGTFRTQFPASGGMLNTYIAPAQIATQSAVLSVGTWAHVAVVFDGTQPVANDRVKVFIDGILQPVNISNTIPATLPVGTGARLGAHSNNALNANMQMDEMRVWNTVRTQTEIASNMNSEIASPPASLLAYYKFNQGIAIGNNVAITSITDATGNGNNGSPNNLAMTGCTSNFVCGAPTLGACTPVGYCNPTWLGTTNSDWNTSSNWGGGAPTASDDITILNQTNDPLIGTNVTVGGDLEVQGGALLNVGSGGTLTLNGALTNNGNVTIQSGGSFLQGASSSIAGSGTFSVQRQGSSSLYNMWSSPITAQSGVPGTSYEYVSSASTQDDSDDVNDPGWSSYNGTMTPGKGYAGLGGGTASFTGAPNNGNVNLGLFFTAFDNTYTQTSAGTPFNLVGNPYPSAISASSFLAANPDLNGTIYLWKRQRQQQLLSNRLCLLEWHWRIGHRRRSNSKWQYCFMSGLYG